MAHQQKLKRSRTLESKGLHLLVHATKKQKLVKALTKEKRLNGVRSVVLEEMVELEDPRVKAYAEVVAAPGRPFYVVFNAKSMASRGKRNASFYVYMNVEQNSRLAPLANFQKDVEIGSDYC